MVDLRKLETAAPTVATYPGVIVLTSGVLGVNVNGNVIPARWADPLVVSAGDPVLVEVSGGTTGGAEAFVRCRLNASPRPAQATVATVPPASPTITVTGTDGGSYTATFVASYTPTVNDVVILSWNAAIPTVLGKVGAVPSPAPVSPVAPPPGAPPNGTSFYPATDTGTWTPGLGAWDVWAGGGGNVYQGGSAYGGPSSGAFFYSGTPSDLAGRTINRVRFRLGTRRGVGSYNQPVTVHFYAHTSPNKPGGDVARTVGPFDVTVQPGAGPQNIDLPTSFAAPIIAGGGVSISGEPYAGFIGRLAQPDSGTLTLDWSR